MVFTSGKMSLFSNGNIPGGLEETVMIERQMRSRCSGRCKQSSRIDKFTLKESQLTGLVFAI